LEVGGGSRGEVGPMRNGGFLGAQFPLRRGRGASGGEHPLASSLGGRAGRRGVVGNGKEASSGNSLVATGAGTGNWPPRAVLRILFCHRGLLLGGDFTMPG